MSKPTHVTSEQLSAAISDMLTLQRETDFRLGVVQGLHRNLSRAGINPSTPVSNLSGISNELRSILDSEVRQRPAAGRLEALLQQLQPEQAKPAAA